jgi:biotin transporter BioY
MYINGTGVILSMKLTYQTLTVFLAGVLMKRYTNPSSDIIAVLTGLHEVDSVFADFAGAIETTIRNGRNCQ